VTTSLRDFRARDVVTLGDTSTAPSLCRPAAGLTQRRRNEDPEFALPNVETPRMVYPTP